MTGYTADTPTVSGTMPAEAVTVTVTYTPDAATVISIALNTPTLDATGVSGKNVTVAADVDAQGEGTITVTPTPASGEVTVANDVANATFAADWNAGVEWTLAADGVAPLTGKSYLKAETQWFSTSAADLATANGTIDQTSTPSAEGQQVRIQTRITFGAQGSASAPDVSVGDRGGISVVNGAFKAYNGSEWVTLTGVTPSDSEVDLLMVADFDGNAQTVRYYIDGKPLYMAVDGGTDVYAIPLASGNAYLTGVGFSDASAVGSAVTAEYDVPYAAAIGTTGYTTFVAATNALVRDGTATLELLANVDPAATINLASGESVKVKAGSFTGLTVDTDDPSLEVESSTADGVTTYTTVAKTFTVLWVVDGTTVETDENVAYNATPSYDGTTPTKDDAQYTYTFTGWATSAEGDVIANLPAVTADATYYAQFSATPKATGAVSGGVLIKDETLTFTSIEVGNGTVTVTFEAEFVVEDEADTTEIPFGILYKTNLAAESNSKAANAALVTLDEPAQGEEYSTGTAVITLPQGVTDSFFLIGFDSKTEDNASSGD